MPKKTRFETVPLTDIAHIAGAAAVDGAGRLVTPATILSISYDRDLLVTRELILSRAGYKVCSVRHFDEAVEQCDHQNFDLVVIGHSIPDADKRAIIAKVNGRPGTAILSLRRPGDRKLQGVGHELDPADGPEIVLAMVAGILRARRLKK